MKIGIIGASGKSGQTILEEALKRGLDITAIVRNASKVTQSVQIIEKSILDLTTDDIKSFDVVINTFAAPLTDAKQYLVIGKHLISLFKHTQTRLIVVGGAGRLYVDEARTTHLFETANFPEFLIDSSKNQYESYQELKSSSIDWTYVSPAAFFDHQGNRTGKYLIGTDRLMLNSKGESYISYADLAVVIIDLVINKSYIRKAITVIGDD